MTIQVWRPEFERPGRHFVYTTRYVYFFVGLLDQLDDRVSLDQLLRRVRKKQGDFINHTKLWEDSCLLYAKMIRRAAKIREGHEEGVFKPIGWEEFSNKTARLESFTQLVSESQPLLELIRDSLELKKLNNNLMKVTMFEDLIADLYARLYEVNMPLLIEQENEENKEKMKVDHLLMAGDGPAESSTPSTSVPASEAPAPRGRTKGIARRDIQKRADTIVNLKLAPRTTTSKFTAAGDTEQSSSVTAASTTTTATAPTSAPRDASKQAPTSGDMDSAQNGGSKDSADDTELSEADKQSKTEEQKLGSTPNLSKSDPISEAEDTGSGNEGADEGDGDGSEDEAGNDQDNDNDDGDGDDDGDQVATEAETDALEGEYGDGDGDGDGDGGGGDNETEDEEMQDTEAEPKPGDGGKEEKEGDSNAAEQSSEFAKSNAPVKSEEAGEPEPMDVTPAGQ